MSAGHNFCRTCLRQALQHKRQCPHCREVLPPATREFVLWPYTVCACMKVLQACDKSLQLQQQCMDLRLAASLVGRNPGTCQPGVAALIAALNDDHAAAVWGVAAWVCLRLLLLRNSGWQPKVNTALWNTISLLFPQHAAQAPPPTPPGGGQGVHPAAASGPAAAAGSRGQRAAGAGSQRAVGMMASEGGGRMRSSSTHRMAEAVAAVRDDWTSHAAARQPFRPPR